MSRIIKNTPQHKLPDRPTIDGKKCRRDGILFNQKSGANSYAAQMRKSGKLVKIVKTSWLEFKDSGAYARGDSPELIKGYTIYYCSKRK